jgi:hypothetical protein
MHLNDKLTAQIISSSKTQQALDYHDEDEAFTATVGKPTYFCVGIVDIVNSTKTVARLPANKSSRYYEIFLNILKTGYGCFKSAEKSPQFLKLYSLKFLVFS